MTVTDEELMAYVDGELDAARSDSLRKEIAASAELTRKVAEQQSLRDRVRHAFDRTLNEPVPPRLTHLTSHDGVIHRARATRHGPSRKTWLGGLALAASVVLGVALGSALLKHDREQPDTIAMGTDVPASGALAGALSRRLASEQSAADSIRLGVSFLAKSGEYCRTFVSRHGEDAQAGMACRHGDGWRIEALQSVTITAGDTDGYRQAATSLPPRVLKAAEAAMTGDPLDALGEAEARDRNWKPPATTTP